MQNADKDTLERPYLHCFVLYLVERIRYIFETAIRLTRFLFCPASACPDCFVAFQLCLLQYHLTKLDAPQSTTVRDRHIALQPWEMCRVQAPRLVPDEEGGAEIEVLHARCPPGGVRPARLREAGHIRRRMNGWIIGRGVANMTARTFVARESGTAAISISRGIAWVVYRTKRG